MASEALPVQAVAASLGCGNPTAAELHAGERVLDLGSAVVRAARPATTGPSRL